MTLLRPDLSDLPAYQRPAEPPAGLRLHMNEAAADWPQAARNALLARLRDLPFHLYPERQGELSERPIALEELLQSPRVLLFNSVRGMYPVEVVKAKCGAANAGTG